MGKRANRYFVRDVVETPYYTLFCRYVPVPINVRLPNDRVRIDNEIVSRVNSINREKFVNRLQGILLMLLHGEWCPVLSELPSIHRFRERRMRRHREWSRFTQPSSV
jgi:hypothetical protein